MADDEAGGAAGGGLHIAMLPWLAFGHMIPFLELAKSLAQRGHRVSFLVTPGNLLRLPSVSSPLLRLVPLPLPPVEGLPPGAESTLDLPPDLVPLLKKAADGLGPPVSDFLLAHSPDWVITDFAFYWLPDIAASAGSRSAYFSVFRAASVAFFFPPGRDGFSWTSPEELTRQPTWIPAYYPPLALRLHEAIPLFSAAVKSISSGVSDIFRFKETIRGCDALAIRSSAELEPEFLAYLGEFHCKPVHPVGVLPPPPRSQPTAESVALAWIDQKPPGSVVYVAFGSEARLSREQTEELALGLELSGSPFLWAYRAGSAEDALPVGYEDRVSRGAGRGLVCREWVPQLDVLANAAVGGFLTHAGWSSVVEGVGSGKPLVFLPLMVDQGLTARAMEEMGAGVVVPREEQTGAFTRDAVAEVVGRVMGEESGALFRARVGEVKEIFSSQDLNGRYVDHFAQFLRDNRPSGSPSLGPTDTA